MEFESAKRYIHILLNHVFDIMFINNLGVNHAEHIFRQILSLLKNDNDLENWFMELIRCNILSDEKNMTKCSERPEWFVDPDLILFIAHAMRLEGFKTLVDDRKAKLSVIKTLNHERDFSDQLASALADDWEERELYEFFRERPTEL